MRRDLDRRILALAVPALGALVAEPVFVLVDSAMVGHLGTAELAGLTLASTLLVTAVGLFVFLAYATTASVGRLLGAGQERRAIASGVDGMWLALVVGVLVAAAGILAAPWAIAALGGTGEVHAHGVTYLRTSLPGLPGMLVVLAATGVLRGMLDTRTPLVVAGVGAVANTGINALFIYGFGWGIGGSGAGTAVVQLAMGGVLAWRVARGARARGAPLTPSLGGLGQGLRDGAPLFLRTLTLRAAILVTVATAATLGDVPLAAHQVVNSLWGFAAFALDALAIAAQALVGRALGAADAGQARAVLRRTLQWGAGAGAALGVVLAALAVPLSTVFSADGDVRRAATAGILVIAVAMPLAGIVFVLDGVLIGAGDGRFLAWAGVVSLVAYLPFVLLVRAVAPRAADGTGSDAAAVVWLWVAFAVVFMIARGLATYLRSRGTRWLVLGAR